MTFFNKQNLSLVLMLIPTSYIIGIAVTEFFVLLSILLFFIFNKDHSLYLDKKNYFFINLFFLYFFKCKISDIR